MEDFETRTAQWLLENPLEQPGWVVEDLIPCGLTLFAGDPKIGKSWLGLDLALHVASGEPFWGFATAKGTVLYLCLEDTFGRVQRRLQRLVDEANDNLCCVVSARRIGTGLIEQLDSFAGSHPDLRMVIVDTFQTVRTPSNQTIYSADYEDMGALKAFADEWKIVCSQINVDTFGGRFSTLHAKTCRPSPIKPNLIVATSSIQKGRKDNDQHVRRKFYTAAEA